MIIFSSTSFCLFKDPPTLKPSNKTTVREGTSDVRIFCDVVTDGNPAKYSNLIWQHWIGNTFIRKLDPDNLPNGSPIKTFSLTMQSVRINQVNRQFSCFLPYFCFCFFAKKILKGQMKKIIKQHIFFYLNQISFNDIGTYVCLTTSSGVGGNITQSASTELVVEGKSELIINRIL